MIPNGGNLKSVVCGLSMSLSLACSNAPGGPLEGPALNLEPGSATGVAGATGTPPAPDQQQPQDASDGSSATVPTLPASCVGPCNAATPSNPQRFGDVVAGDVTMYSTSASAGGACGYGATGILDFAAINVNIAYVDVPGSPGSRVGDGLGEWQQGMACGQCVEVTILTSSGTRTAVVRIMDRCADENCGIDLGGSMPARLMGDGPGRYKGTWRYISCEGHPSVFDGNPSLYVKEGSSAGWSAVQVRNPLMGVLGIDWEDTKDKSHRGSFVYAYPNMENFYFVPVELLQGDSTYRVTIRYRDNSVGTVRLTSAELGVADRYYPLEN